MTEQSQTFTCKRCGQERSAEQEVVTRWHTRTCRQCWGAKVSAGRRWFALPKTHTKPDQFI